MGQVSQRDIEATLNMGVGMAAVVAPEDADAAVQLLADRGVDAWICGEMVASSAEDPRVELAGQHR